MILYPNSNTSAGQFGGGSKCVGHDICRNLTLSCSKQNGMIVSMHNRTASDNRRQMRRARCRYDGTAAYRSNQPAGECEHRVYND